jgi:hypothetical protein
MSNLRPSLIGSGTLNIAGAVEPCRTAEKAATLEVGTGISSLTGREGKCSAMGLRFRDDASCNSLIDPCNTATAAPVWPASVDAAKPDYRDNAIRRFLSVGGGNMAEAVAGSGASTFGQVRLSDRRLTRENSVSPIKSLED